MQLRPYQLAALDALNSFWQTDGGHPLVAMATATGKSLVIAKLIADISARYPRFRALVLVHVRELVQQNLFHLLKIWPNAPVGINSAGLKKRDWHSPIVLANIQSIFRTPQRLGRRDLVIIDEAHLVPHFGDGMYRSVIDGLRELEPALRVCGLTATPYRLDSGRLDEGDGKIFDEIVYEYGIAEGIRDGWLSPLSSKATTARINVEGVAVRGGEFVPGALEDAADDDAVVDATVGEIIERGRDRKSWLIFCAGVHHALHVRDVLCERGVAAETITATTPSDERDTIVAGFQSGTIRALTNVNVLTTGFNVPAVDLIAMLRPTLSTGLYVQMVGRGTRKADGKRDCLVLDFAGNVMRHGPVDRVNVGNAANKAPAGVKVDIVAAKRCPECSELNALCDAVCSSCGHEFPMEKPAPKHAATADAVPILGGTSDWLPVTEVSARRHLKYTDPAAPPSLRIEYLCGLSAYSEYLSLERTGYAREMAERAWYGLGGNAPAPTTVDAAIERVGELDPIVAITVTRNGKFWNVVEKRVLRPDGSKVDVNRWGHCTVAHDRVAALPPPINDEVRF
jgi:DNA repair protein RadD